MTESDQSPATAPSVPSLAPAPEPPVQRRLAAILHMDVVGYSRLLVEDELGTLKQLNLQREKIQVAVAEHNGRILGSSGDDMMIVFASAVEAVRCATRLQVEIAEMNLSLPENRRVVYRMGVNVGEVVEEGPRMFGSGINIAARIQGLADAGGLFISATVFEQVAHRLALGYEDLGRVEVKNIPQPVHVYRVRTGREGPTPLTPVAGTAGLAPRRPDWANAAPAERRLLVALLLCLPFGFLGTHRFYAGKPVSGVAMLLTFGGAGLWWLGDLALIAVAEFRDGSGRRMRWW